MFDSRELVFLWGRLGVLNICVILAALHAYTQVTINAMQSFREAYTVFSQIGKTFPIFHGSRVFITVFTRAYYLSPY
jgi:hypothetical protein